MEREEPTWREKSLDGERRAYMEREGPTRIGGEPKGTVEVLPRTGLTGE